MSRRAYVFWWCIGIALVLFIAARMTMDLGPAYVKERLESYRERLEHRGEKFSITDFTPPPAPLENNGAPAAVAAAQELSDLVKKHSLALVRTGHAVPGSGPVYHKRETALRKLSKQESKDIPWDALAAEMAPLQEPLRRIKEAARQPTLAVDLDYSKGFAMRLDAIGPLLKACQYLGVDGLLLLHNGNVSDTIENVRTQLRIAQIPKDQPSAICQLTFQAMVGIAQLNTWEILHADGVTAAELEQLQAIWQAVRPTSQYANTLRMERAIALPTFSGSADPFQIGSADKFKNGIKFTVWKMYFRTTDEYQFLKDYQALLKHFDAGTKPNWPEIFTTSTEIEERLKRAGGVSLWVCKMLNATLKGTLEKLAISEAIGNMTLTAIAIRRYQLAHAGALPKTLEDLTPQYFKTPPRDPMSGKPLVYKNEGSDFLLYSVGLDGIDEGGNISSATEKPPRGFTDCKDIVWPRVAPVQALQPATP